MEEIEKRFNDEFSPWNVRLPEVDITNRRRGKFIEVGWAFDGFQDARRKRVQEWPATSMLLNSRASW